MVSCISNEAFSEALGENLKRLSTIASILRSLSETVFLCVM